jgi:hypothetical protein
MSSDRIQALSRHLAAPASRRTLFSLIGVGVVGTAVTAGGLGDAVAKGNHRQRNKGKSKSNNNQNASFERFTGLPVSAHDQKGHNFKGTLDITSFAVQNEAIVALGTVSGKVTGQGFGNQAVSAVPVTVPVSFPTGSADVRAQATCNILDLTLGPIHLDLLGLVLDTNQIHIQLTANTAGGLLGDLLCGIANLLNGGGLLADIADLLNQILTALQGL